MYEVSPEEEMQSQQEESVTKRNEKLQSIGDIKLSKLGTKEYLIANLSDSFNPIHLKNLPSLLKTASTNSSPTMGFSLKPTEIK